jgi:tRNA-binding protein
MNSAPIKPLISTSDLDKIDVRIGTIIAVEDVAHSETPVWLRVDFGDINCLTISLIGSK